MTNSRGFRDCSSELLSDRHRAEVVGFAEELLRQGLSTEQCDRAWAEGTVVAAYRAARLKPPGRIIWRDSPFAGAMLVRSIDAEPMADRLREEFTLERDIATSVGVQTTQAMFDALRPVIHGPLWDQMWRELRGRLYFRIAQQLREHPPKAPPADSGRGGHGPLDCDMSLWRDSYDLCRLAYSRRLLGLPALSRTDALIEACRRVGWWWPMKDVAVLTDRPTLIGRDKQARLHSADGPALSYADGNALHYWHGTHVPSWVIDDPAVGAILVEPNAEVRRCAIESLGWARFIAGASLTKIAECPDPGNPPHTISLWELPQALADTVGPPSRILLCTNGTPDHAGEQQHFGLMVGVHHTDPVEAAAELYDMPAQAYRDLEIRT